MRPGDPVPAAPASAAPVGPSGQPITLADTEGDMLEHGRIGYGTRTPWVMAALLVLVVAAIGLAGWLRGSAGDDGPRVAPDFSLTLFDGSTFRLSEHRGKVVVVNFWASWCDPCDEELPALQQASAQVGPDVVFVGIGGKLDHDDKARAFAAKYGVTYPIGRDTEGGDANGGEIQQAYGAFALPATFVIAPDGTIASVLMTPFDEASDILPAIEDARD